jgi:crotonobetainyl-CoA:carnitine CoA-transferase CaiB-like acyl-CoA transferase
MLANEYIIDFAHPVLGQVKLLGLPVKFHKTPGMVQNAAPELGQHTEEVLLEIGEYTWEEINELREQGVI